VERARHRNPEFCLTPENANAVGRICERLEGIPLAIELAAARVGMSLEQIASRLDDSLRLLTWGSRTASPRRRTLRGTLDWSYALLWDIHKGGSSIPQDPDVKRHAEVVERLGNGSLR
jgi:predicted ATPase